MKKYISAVTIAAILLTFTGCANSNNSSTASDNTSTSSVTESTTDTTTDSTTTSETTTESTPEESTPEESTPEESTPEESTPEESTPEDSTPEETEPAETTPAETKPAETKPAETKPAETKPAETKPAETKPTETEPVESEPEETPEQGESKCEKLANAALNSIEFPAMMPVDGESLQSFYGIDISLCDDYFATMSMMSVHLNEVIVLKPSAGNENTVTEQIKAHLEYQRENGIWYPAQEASVAGAVWGVTKGGYIYLVIHAEGQTAADAIIAAE